MPEYRQTVGFARIAHAVKKIRKNNPNVLFVDGGDFMHGTGLAVLSQGSVIIPLLNAWPYLETGNLLIGMN
ncbi:2',3'-cyclic-nucleotide 2'-phosphodiesterase (5'-nucleotidase family) [Paenibacillus sp. PastF-3]|uniref:hypothetical protein n=1 Tax=Paenibacillus sp. PastF-3 TaxID=2940626 RepID=UPI002473382A|nr:hypothetical protein [Paenibacillus sp. PastF-3]MDH6373168.1 2',3'-cyclic-nucleotide 2'-phosphodiesterase (5'-nucleotidase family) [Paenibacillus sp. PastF-3]